MSNVQHSMIKFWKEIYHSRPSECMDYEDDYIDVKGQEWA